MKSLNIKKTLLMALTLSALSGCIPGLQKSSGSAVSESPGGFGGFTLAANQKLIQGNFFNGTRIYYLAQDFGQTWEGFATAGNPLFTKTGMINDGFQFVVLNFQGSSASDFADGGAAYRAAWVNRVEATIAWADATYGTANKNIIGGYGYGALHAMIAMEDLPNRFIAFFAIQPSFVNTELGVSASSFTPNEAALSTKPGLISYGSLDGQRATQAAALIQALQQRGASISNYSYGVGHTPTMPIATDMENFIKGF
jgi:predicted esterase